ncbi:MAG TPA: hypothetical protein VEA61_03350 [Allosphingosinicella sp.]|nr:hypothetical protein [Allosphingosinicella sp.]
MASARMIATAVVLGLVWFALVPLAFVTFYSALEMHSAARAAYDNGDARLATYRVVTLANDLAAAEEEARNHTKLTHDRQVALQELFEERDAMRRAAVSILTTAGVRNASRQCTAPAAERKLCQLDRKLEHCTADWQLIIDCSEQAAQLSQGRTDLSPKAANLDAAQRKAIEKSVAVNRISASLRQSSAKREQLTAALKDPLRPVAESYRSIELPAFRWLFALPQGVVVAVFTALMASIGAAVGSLVTLLRRRRESPDEESYYFRAFIASPLLGALTGFMVYFVVSAGTAFLVPETQATAVSAVNNLSVPALASLGVFAGLGAESAIAWLTRKAKGFFGG